MYNLVLIILKFILNYNWCNVAAVHLLEVAPKPNSNTVVCIIWTTAPELVLWNSYVRIRLVGLERKVQLLQWLYNEVVRIFKECYCHVFIRVIKKCVRNVNSYIVVRITIYFRSRLYTMVVYMARPCQKNWQEHCKQTYFAALFDVSRLVYTGEYEPCEWWITFSGPIIWIRTNINWSNWYSKLVVVVESWENII